MRAGLVVAVLSFLAVAGCQCGGPVATGTGGGTGGDGGSTTGGGAGGSSTGGGSGGSTGGGAGGGSGCLPSGAALTLSPSTSTVAVGATPSAIAFTATSGGTDVTSRLTWTATRTDDSPAGGFSSPGSYSPAPGVGGTVTITASDGCGATASTTVALTLSTVFHDPGPTVTARFSGTVVNADATRSPVIVYPSHQTRFPRNIYKVLFQWKKQGNDFFRLTFTGPGSTTVVYSDGANLACQASAATNGCAETDLAQWQAIAGSNAGQVVSLVIDGVRQADPSVYRSAAIELGFSKRDVKGAIFYWSTTAAGIRRASVSDRAPEDYLVGKPVGTQLVDGGTVSCVACHTVSRSGKKLVAFTQTAVKGEFTYDVTLSPPPLQRVTTQISTQKGFGTFSPDDTRVVATVGSLLAEFDSDTGVKHADLPVAAGTNPDWSPTGTELAFSDKGGDSPGTANLKVIATDGGAWGSVRTLVPAAGQTNLFPSYSPDGAWVVYARGKGGHGDVTLQLWLVKADGSQPPVELVTANRVVNNALTAGRHENNMPTWAPPGDLLWVAFNSVRPYGVVFPTGGQQQIWVAAIDPAKLGTLQSDGGLADPSFPAFRFAFQGLGENNHRAFWTLDVRDPQDAGTASSCGGLGDPCANTSGCCAGLVCDSSELVQSCQPPRPDAGACLAEGATCDQTGGAAACCANLFCDVNPDGGATACRALTFN